MIPFQFSLPDKLNWREVRAFLRFVLLRLGQARLQEAAGSLTFVTLLSLVPLLAIALAVFTQFPMFGTLRESLEAYFAQAMLPKSISNTILGYLSHFAAKAAQVSLFGALGLFVSAVAAVRVIELAFNDIWRIRKQRTVLKRIGLYCSLALLGPFIMAVSLSMTMHLYVATGGALKNPSFFDNLLFTLLSLIWSIAAFTLLYVVIPNRTIHWREAFGGGIFAAIAFVLTKKVFALFLLKFSAYNKIYGTVAAVPILLLWIYLSWLITLAGAALTAALHYLWRKRWRNVRTAGGTFLDAVELLGVLYSAQGTDAYGVSEAEMRQQTGFGLDEIERLLYPMQAEGWVERVRPDAIERIRERNIRADVSDYWRLLADPRQLSLADLYRFFVFSPPEGNPLADRADTALAQGLSQTLAEYYSREPQPTQS